MDSPILVKLWGRRVGALLWNPRMGFANFEYDRDFLKSGWNISPLKLPLSDRVFGFPELSESNTFQGLPGFIADSLPEKYGNKLLHSYLAKKGRRLEDLSPLERICLVGNRGMGALEYEPDTESPNLNKALPVVVSELAELAELILKEKSTVKANLDEMKSIISVGTSAGGAKAKAVIAINDNTKEVLSGQSNVPEGFEHWILKFDEMENEEHATSKQIGRIEYAYNQMAYEAGINVMESRLLHDGDKAHFLTKRFDRVDGNEKIHTVTLAGIAHLDRDPPGTYGYENLFQVMRELGLPQNELDEMYRRMVFNIIARNQDDHTKNHAFLMFGDGEWTLSPAYDLCFSYKPGSIFIERHQMSCNGKRDHFTLPDLIIAGKSADTKKPMEIIEEVEIAIKKWSEIATAVGIREESADSIGKLHRFFIP